MKKNHEKFVDLIESNISRKKSHYSRCPTFELLCNSLSGRLPKKNCRALVYMNWIDSHRPADEGVTGGNCRMNHLLFADELVLYAWISSTGSLFDRFNAACDQARMKISTKKIEVLCLSRRPRQCILQVRGNTLQLVETPKYLGVVFTSDGSRNKRVDTRIGRANAVLREL